MSKYTLLAILFIFEALTAMMVQAVESYGNTSYSTSGVTGVSWDEDTGALAGAWNGIKAIFRLITFQVDGIPDVLTTLIFIPITLIFIYMVIDLLKDLVPFT